LWRVLVDPYAVPSGSTAYDYRDAITSPTLGSVTTSDALADRAPGASWTVGATVTAAAAPPADRDLTGPLQVLTDTGIVLATGWIEATAPGAPTTTVVATSPSPSSVGQDVTLTATVDDDDATGRVVFTAGD